MAAVPGFHFACMSSSASGLLMMHNIGEMNPDRVLVSVRLDS